MSFTRRMMIKSNTQTFRVLQWLGAQPGPLTIPELHAALQTQNAELATEVESRTRLVRMIHFARARNLVKGHVWRESPVTASNPKRLHFRFELNRDNFALLQKRLADKQQEDASSS